MIFRKIKILVITTVLITTVSKGQGINRQRYQTADPKYVDFMYKPNFNLMEKVIRAEARNTYLRVKQTLSTLYKMLEHSNKNEFYVFANEFRNHINYFKNNNKFYNMVIIKRLENNYIKFLDDINKGLSASESDYVIKSDFKTYDTANTSTVANKQSKLIKRRTLLLNEGIKFYNNKKYKAAIKNLKKTLSLSESITYDTDFDIGLVTYYVGVIADKLGDYKTAKKYFGTCIWKGYQEASPYKSLSNIYKKENNSKKELEILQDGYNKYPDSEKIVIALVNYYLTNGHSYKALEKLNKAVELDPKNPSYYYVIGTLYDEMANNTTNEYNYQEKEKYINLAVNAYKSAKSLKSDYFEPSYNIGALYYNKAAHILKEASKLSLVQKKEYEAAVKASERQFELARPHMEDAHRISPKEKSPITTLITIYHKLKMNDKKNEFEEKLRNL